MNIQAHRDGSAMPGTTDQGLLKEKGGRGFPYCAIMNGEGDVIWEVRPTSQAAFDGAVSHAAQLQKLQAMLADKPADAGLKASVALLAGMGYEQRPGPTPKQLAQHAAVEGVDPKVVSLYEEWRVGAEIMGALRSRDGRVKAYEMFKKGVKPPATFGFAEYYYMYAAQGAIEKKDGKCASKAAQTFAMYAEKKPDDQAGNSMRKMAKDLQEKAAALSGDGDKADIDKADIDKR